MLSLNELEMKRPWALSRFDVSKRNRDNIKSNVVNVEESKTNVDI